MTAQGADYFVRLSLAFRKGDLQLLAVGDEDVKNLIVRWMAEAKEFGTQRFYPEDALEGQTAAMKYVKECVSFIRQCKGHAQHLGTNVKELSLYIKGGGPQRYRDSIKDSRVVEKEAKDDSWSEDEEQALRKLLSKFPTGTRKRWEVISASLSGRSVEEVIVKSKELESVKCTDSSLSNEAQYERFLKERRKGKSSEIKINDTPSENLAMNDTSVGEWSKARDAALVRAMKEFSKEVKDRYRKPCQTRLMCWISQSGCASIVQVGAHFHGSPWNN